MAAFTFQCLTFISINLLSRTTRYTNTLTYQQTHSHTQSHMRTHVVVHTYSFGYIKRIGQEFSLIEELKTSLEIIRLLEEVGFEI